MNGIIMYGTDWCGDCLQARRVLSEAEISYQWINIDNDIEGEKFVIKTNHGNRSVPTILFPDGAILVEPTNAVLRNKIAQMNKLP